MENYLGEHVLAEFHECDNTILNDIGEVKELMLEAAKIAKANVVEKYFHKFSPYGISGILVLAESHLAIHTWPEYNYAAVDFFTCSKNCNTRESMDYLRVKFKCRIFKIKTIKRGEFNKSLIPEQPVSFK